MKTMTVTDIMADFLDSIRDYEHESGKAIYFDERESSEFVDMYFNGGGKINMKTTGQVFDEINGMSDGDIMEVYKVREGFKTKFQTGWTPAPTDILCSKCGGVMEFIGKALLTNPLQYEYRCKDCKNIEYRMEK